MGKPHNKIARSDPQKVGIAAKGGNPYEKADAGYQKYRPGYFLPSLFDALVPFRYGPAWEKQVGYRFSSAENIDLRAETGNLETGKIADNAAGKSLVLGKMSRAVQQNNALLASLWEKTIPGSAPQQIRVLDCGAGSGKFSLALHNNFAPVIAEKAAAASRLEASFIKQYASEPAEAMRKQFQACPQLEDIPLYEYKAEEIEQILARENLASERENFKFDVIVYAQCWHWLDPEKSCQKADKMLSPEGQIAIVFNQLNVSFPWVRHLSRVMRSGDVHFPERPPRLGAGFTAPQLRLRQWSTEVTVADLFALARTRSSYLRATPAGKAHLQNNLREFLFEELGLSEQGQLTLPYYTLTWVSKRKS